MTHATNQPAATKISPSAIALAAITVEILVLGALLVAVAGQLTGNPSGSVAMVLTRGGTDDTGLSPLFSARLLTAWQLDPLALTVLVLIAGAYLRRAPGSEPRTARDGRGGGPCLSWRGSGSAPSLPAAASRFMTCACSPPTCSDTCASS